MIANRLYISRPDIIGKDAKSFNLRQNLSQPSSCPCVRINKVAHSELAIFMIKRCQNSNFRQRSAC